MSDSCQQRLQCRQSDVHLFEKLGFCVEEVKDGIAMMQDDEANYAHYDRLPSVPFHGQHGSGGNYDAQLFACDGENIVYVTRDINDNIVVPFDIEEMRVEAIDFTAIKQFKETLTRAKSMLDKYSRSLNTTSL